VRRSRFGFAVLSAFLGWAAHGTGLQGQGSAAGDRAALEALYRATDGPNWHIDTNWLSGEPLSSWVGVTVDGAGRVVDLALGGNNLRGSLPAELGDLTELSSLGLLFNELTGNIPAEVGNLTKLRRLDLQWNRLAGVIPASLGDLADLRVMILANNGLTGEIPASLGRLPHLWSLALSANDLTGPIPEAFGDMRSIQYLSLETNSLSGTLPASLGRLHTLLWLRVGFNAGLTGALPAGLADLGLTDVDIHGTGICVPAADRFRTWAARIEFASSGRTCGVTPPSVAVIDVAVFYTPAARQAAGGASSIEAAIDLMVAEANRAYLDSGVQQKIALVHREETPYVESVSSLLDLERLTDPSDGHLDGIHPIRDAVGADLVHLIVEKATVSGVANLAPRAAGAFALTCRSCTGFTFAHELGHNMGLSHDRYSGCRAGNSCSWAPHYPYGFGYVNQRAFEAGASPSAPWQTIMAYPDQCAQAGISCRQVGRFSDPRGTQGGDPLGVAGERDAAGAGGPADAVRALNEVRHSVASFRPTVAPSAGRGPVTVGRLPDRRLNVGGAAIVVDVSGAFRDPDGDALTYRALSSIEAVAIARSSGTQVTIQPVSRGVSTVTVLATDAGGSKTSAWHQFAVLVDEVNSRDYDTDDDGLIEIRTLAQLDAARYDPTGAGDPVLGRTAYAVAFPDRSVRMGCRRGVCLGYELLVDLDFDTNRSGGPDPGDAWWRDGAGWAPIGGTIRTQFDTTFEGNGRTIRNLFVAGGEKAGLFGWLGPSAVVRRLGLEGVDVTGLSAGALASVNNGVVVASYAAGRVTGSDLAGGLVGTNGGRIASSRTACSVSGTDWAGGLVGWNVGNVLVSYATGHVEGGASGGLVANNSGAVRASYAGGQVEGAANAGGLVARNSSGASIVASYAVAHVLRSAASAGGLVGRGDPSTGRVESSYWDTALSGQTNSNGGSGRATASLQAPTGYDGIYRDWNLDVDADGARDDPWDFGTSTEYPVLKADIDGDGRSTWQEFGGQRGRDDTGDDGPPSGTCLADGETLCLRDSRYAVRVDWWAAAGDSGAGSVVQAGTNDSGMFTFFNRANWEVLIKVLDGCDVNGHVWVFGASTTNLGYVIRVTDTVTGEVKEYRNEAGQAAAAITDVTAFPAIECPVAVSK